MNPTIELLKSHRSIRQFTDQPIQSALLNELVLAGQGAASSSFLQGASIIHVTDKAKRAALAEVANDQAYVETAAEFLVFCADLNRAAHCCDLHGAEAQTDFTEQFIIATVDVALFAQNMVVAAESAGLGICYIGALRNNPAAVSSLLDLPDNTYPVFGLCLGWPDQNPEVKPRLPVDIIMREISYTAPSDAAVASSLAAYDETVRAYYKTRTSNQKSQSWSEQMSGLLGRESRPHMQSFLQARGFMRK